jgi:hypothetical protein
MTAPPLLTALIGQDVVHKCGFLPLIYVIYGAAAMLALRSVPETGDLAFDDLDRPSPQTPTFVAEAPGG